MDLDKFVNRIKRKTGFGSLSLTSDRSTLDIIDSLNERQDEAWRKHNFLFELLPVSIPIVAGQRDYSLTVNDGDIIVLNLVAGGPPLRRFTLKSYLRFLRGTTTDLTGEIKGYIPLGRDTSDRQQIRIVRTPQSASDTIEGFSRKRLTKWEVSDLGSAIEIRHFPRETHPILLKGVLSDIYEIQGKKGLAAGLDRAFGRALDNLWAEENDEPDKRLTSPVPGLWRRRRRSRNRRVLR